MNQHFPEKMTGKTRLSGRQARILVAPLDWGLGHATRCIPVIRELIAQGAQVWLAGEGAQEKLLKEEFPDLPFLPLQGYRIRYAGSASGLVWNMFRQLPKMKKAIEYENNWLKKVVREYRPDAVISDNRYGLYHPDIPSVIITHQLLIKTGWGKWSERILQLRNYAYLNRFNHCWIPDEEGKGNLAGELSHPDKKPIPPVRYIGFLSRFSKLQLPERKDHLLLLLSGPEPQRSLLENLLIAGLGDHNGTATVVRGLPGEHSLIPSTNRVQFYNHLQATALNKEMQEASLIICRSGYSSIMDALALEKKCILVPTPGQTEQEYLGSTLMERGIAVTVAQKEFSLKKALALAAAFNYTFPPAGNGSGLSEAVKTLLHQVAGAALG